MKRLVISVMLLLTAFSIGIIYRCTASKVCPAISSSCATIVSLYNKDDSNGAAKILGNARQDWLNAKGLFCVLTSDETIERIDRRFVSVETALNAGSYVLICENTAALICEVNALYDSTGIGLAHLL